MSTALCWIRRDLRLHDHAALFHATQNHPQVHVVFNFDPQILNSLPKADHRVSFIMQSLQEMETQLQKQGSSLHITYGDPTEEIPKLAQKLKVSALYCNRDYEPYAKKRDSSVEKKLKAQDIDFQQFKDQVMFEKTEVLNNSGAIYKVFTPYKNKWLEKFAEIEVSDFKPKLKNIVAWNNPKNILKHDWFKEIGMSATTPVIIGGAKEASKKLKAFSQIMNKYHETRDLPAISGTSGLSPYLRHGCLSVRDAVRAATESKNEGSRIWLSELIWREFYMMILETHPFVVKESFKREYDHIKWQGSKKHFEAWKNGLTGFPLVDAAMRCLRDSGEMHNRLRMVVASFLCKTLLLDWRLGEAWFAEKLLDFDLAANNGGWQWCSSSGCDAQPYFRIFNPYSQSNKFDPQGEFIRRWCPELAHLSAPDIHCPDPLLAPDYPRPIVSYETNRKTCLDMYAAVKKV